ncbi:hypothetical protein L484_027302 [Morus notabilis]|uniref:F-box associated domain-containing protein n=1 Tax=Morus notabilis TaxID=981085 RepID=W9QS79_9ROSA|nr:hypothetical protein L484_027302 [Morus notabilis]
MPPPRIYSSGIVACGGFVYWMAVNWWKWWGIVAFDPFGDHAKHCRVIDPPANLGMLLQSSSRTNLCLGACRGRLRLSRAFKYREGWFAIKVWELSEDKKSWCLVHTRPA